MDEADPNASIADRPARPRNGRGGPPFLRLPWWFWLAVADVKFWFVTGPAAVALALVGWYGADWLGSLRWIPLGGAALLAIPFPAAALLFMVLAIRDALRQARLQLTLARDETVAGLPLPAGSRIRFRDETHSVVASIDLPRVTEILGMRLTGSLRWDERDRLWYGTLYDYQIIDGWPCRAGTLQFEHEGIVFDPDGVIHRCTLGKAHELLGLRLPPGTRVTRGNDDKPWDLLLPANAGVEIPALATTAPPGVTLSIANDGRLQEIGSGHGQTIVVRDVPLNSKSFRLEGEHVVSQLAEPFVVAGATQPAGTAVRIDLATGNVSLLGQARADQAQPDRP
jgi:hypothetical protein